MAFLCVSTIHINSKIFKTFENDIDGIINKIGILNHTFGEISNEFKIGGISGVKDLFFGSITDSDIDKIREYNSLVTAYQQGLPEGVSAQTAWNRTMLDASTSAQRLVEANNGAAVSEEALTVATQQQTLSAKAATVATKALAIAGNMIAMWAITKGIELAVKGIDELANSVDHCKERVENLMSSYQSALNTANNNASKAEELADKYETLSKGVNNLGENVSLTADEYKEYNNIVNDIAEMFPTLVQGYTDEGNAILSLKGNVEQLRDAYKDAQQEAYNMLIASGEDSDGNDIIKQWEDTHDTGFWAKTLDLGADDVGGGISVSEALEQLKAIQNMSAEEYREIKRITSSGSRKEITSLTDIQKDIGYGSYLHKALGLNNNATDDEFREAQRQAKALAQTYTAEMDSALSDVETLANAYLMTNEDYAKLDEQSKNAASVIVNSLNANIASGFHSKEDVGAYVDGIVQMISSNTEAQDALVGLLSMDTTDMSVDEIQSAVDNYINIISDALKDADLEEDPVELKARLNFDNADTDAQKKKVQGFLKDEFDDKVGELTLEQLDTASKLNVSDDDLLSWDELIAKIQEAKDEASETATSAPISFSEAWEHLQSVGEKAKDVTPELLKLAKAGEISDATLMSNEDYVTLLTETKMSARDARREIMSMLSVQEKMSGLQGKMGNVETLYSEFKDKGFVTAETLESLPEVFKQINGGKDFDLFSQIVGDPTSGKEKIQQAFNDIVTAYIKDQDILVGATEETRDAIIANLSDAGVTNAEAVVDQYINTMNLIDAARDEFNNKTDKQRQEDLTNFQNALENKNTSFTEACNVLGKNNAELMTKLGKQYADDYTNWLNLLEKKKEAFNKFVNEYNRVFVDTNSNGETKIYEQSQKRRNGEAGASDSSMVAGVIAKQQAYNKAAKDADAAEADMKKKLEKMNVDFSGISYSPTTSSSGGSGSSKTSNKTVIDWISKKLDRLNDKISLTQAKYENLVDTLGKNRGKKKKKLAKNSDGLLEAQIENLDEQIKLYDKLAKNEKTAIKRYDKKAKNVKLSSSLKKKVRNGKIGTKKTSMKKLIATYGEKNAKKIQEYEQWYDAARNAEKDYESARASSRKKTEEKYQIQADAAQAKISMYQSQAANAADDYKTQNGYLEKQRELIKKNYDMQIAIADLNKDTVLAAELQAQKAEELAQLEKQKFDNIQADFENRRSTYQMQMDVIEARNNLLEAKGQKIQASSYKAEIKQEQGMLETYKAEKAELEKQIKTIPKGTEEWYRAKEAINKCDVEIINCTASAAELNNKITEIANNAKSALQTAFATMASEGDLYAELMSNKDMFDSETGIITKEGLATLGTYGNGYNVTKASAEMDQKLLNKLNAGLNHDFTKGAFSFIDDNNKERVYNSLDQLEDYIKEVYEDWREQIKNTFEYESKIIDMMRDKLENELSALKDLIDAKKNALSAEKALHDYRKSIKESTSNIASLSKQIVAVQGDTSESGMARIQKLQNQLKEAQEDLAEKEYDHLIQAEQDMLDNLYDEYSDLITNEMQDTRRLLQKGFEMIESSAGTINQTIKDYSGRYGYTPEYNNHMNSGSGDIVNDAKGRKDRSNGFDPSDLLRNLGQNKTPPSDTKKEKPKETKSTLISVPLFTKDELKKLKPKVEKIFDNKKLYKKGTSDGTAINNFLYKKNGKILTSKALEKLRKICGTNDNNVMFDVLKSISKNIGNIKNVGGFKDGGIAKVVKSKGEDGLIMARNGEGFVKPEHVGEIKKLMDALPQLNAAMNYQIDMPKMPEVKPVQVNPNQVVEIGNVTLPNVTNYEEFKTQMFKDMQKDTKFEKMLQSMTISKIATPQHNRFSKNSIRF